MTVKELQKILSHYPQDMDVVIRHDNPGNDEPDYYNIQFTTKDNYWDCQTAVLIETLVAIVI